MQETPSAENLPGPGLGPGSGSGPVAANAIRPLGPVFFYFVAAGIATIMLGPLLPSLIQRWHILDEQAGTLFTASFLGQLTGSWFGTRNLRLSILCGAALSAAGCLAMPWTSFPAAHVALFCIGVGLGAGLTAGNIIVGTAVPASRARLLAMLNVAWGSGAIACPLIVRLTTANGIGNFFLLTASCLFAATLYAITIPTNQYNASPDNTIEATHRNSAASQPLPITFVITMGAILLLYIGVESALGGWLPSYAVRTSPLLRASSVSLCFWVAELSGRLITASIRTKEAALYRSSLALLLLAELLLCTTQHLSSIGILGLTALIGLTLAPLYPLIVASILERTGNHPRLGPLFASASLGGAGLPWLTGFFSTQLHGLRAGLIVPATGTLLLFLLSAPVIESSNADSKQSI